MGIKEHEVEKSYYQLLEFKQEVADFLLYVTGSHSHKEYEEHWIESAREKGNRLRDKEGEACILVGLLHQYDKPEYVFFGWQSVSSVVSVWSVSGGVQKHP